MHDDLDDDSRADLIKYRLERSRLSIEEAKNSAQAGFYNAAVNRLYYACYYAAIALLLTKKLYPNSHKGVKGLLNLHFVRSGIISQDTAKTFSILFESRQSGDYEDFVFYDISDYDRLLPRTINFIETVESLV